MIISAWTCTFCWTRNGSLRFACKHCGQSKPGRPV